ncbi:MAG TPA: Holliday junction resolvase RuvX [Chitinophagales bacterium]
MPRIMAFDYGRKRVGVAVTDTNKIIASALDTIDTKVIYTFIQQYLAKEEVEAFVVGMPYNFGHAENEVMSYIRTFISELKKKFPSVPVHEMDERFTSKMASAVILQSGVNRKARQEKGTVDKVSAAILLQSFMETKSI